MKILKYLAVFSLAFSFTSLAHAYGEVFYNVPFSNVEVKAASKIYAYYEFAAHHQTVSCKALSTNVINSVEWSYKNATRKVEMPVTLKDDSRFAGYYADPEGHLVVTNEFGPDSIFVTCEYHNMK